MNTEQKPQIIKAAALILNDKGELLIVKSKKKDVWMSLGGKPEGDESLEQALAREIKEEVGLMVEAAELYAETPIEIAAGTTDLTVKIYFFLTKAVGEIQLNPEDNINEVKWISVNDFRDIEAGKSIQIGSGLQYYAIPKLIKDKLMR